MIAILDPFAGGAAPLELSPAVREILSREPFRSAVECTIRASLQVGRSSERVRGSLRRADRLHRPTARAITDSYRIFLRTRMALERTAQSIVSAAALAAERPSAAPLMVGQLATGGFEQKKTEGMKR